MSGKDHRFGVDSSPFSVMPGSREKFCCQITRPRNPLPLPLFLSSFFVFLDCTTNIRRRNHFLRTSLADNRRWNAAVALRERE